MVVFVGGGSLGCGRGGWWSGRGFPFGDFLSINNEYIPYAGYLFIVIREGSKGVGPYEKLVFENIVHIIRIDGSTRAWHFKTGFGPDPYRARFCESFAFLTNCSIILYWKFTGLYFISQYYSPICRAAREISLKISYC